MYDPNQDSLEHYGVLGMKWGVRKNPDRAYEKAGKKLRKLDKDVLRLRNKQHKAERKAGRRHKEKYENKARYRKYYADEALDRAIKWSKKMKDVFDGVTLSNASDEITKLGESYIQMEFDRQRR